MKLKWIFAALVLANLGLWMWANWYKQAPEEESRVAREPVAAEKMRLLNEAAVKPAPRRLPPPANAELTAAGAPACFHIGPFPDADLVTRGEARLRGLELAYSRRAEESRTITGYLVYLPPLPSPQAAERKRQELTRLGFKDHALMQDENMQNAISLGLFSVEANADNRVRELAARKVQAKVQPFEQTRTRFWLDASVKVPSETADLIKQIDWGAKDILAREIPCPAGATAPPAKPLETLDKPPG